MANPLPALPDRDPSWLAYLRTLMCTCCLCRGPCIPHHARHVGGYGGTGLKPPDRLAVPLCDECHRRIHGRGPSSEEKAQMNERLVYLLNEYMERALSAEEEF